MRPLDYGQVRDRLAELTYRPNWTFELHQGAYEGPRLRISATVLNSYDPYGDPVPLDIWVPLPPFLNTGALDGWLLWRLQQVEIHEAMEWLHGPDGRPLFDPHRPQADRDEHVAPEPPTEVPW